MRLAALTRKGWRQFWLLITASCVLTACSPTFDWRVVRPDQAPFMIDMPAKPATLTRKINLDGLPVSMEMHGARVGKLNFTAAWARLPEADSESGPEPGQPAAPDTEVLTKALAAMQQGMLNNIGGKVIAQRPQTLALVNPLGEQAGLIPATFVEASGSAGGEAVRMQAVFVSLNRMLLQFVVLGTDWSEEAAGTFLASVRLRLLPAPSQ